METPKKYLGYALGDMIYIYIHIYIYTYIHIHMYIYIYIYRVPLGVSQVFLGCII